MAKNTCASTTIYEISEDRLIEPFKTQRIEKALAMFNKGKCESFPNYAQPDYLDFLQIRYWVDHAAAQEYIDYIMSLAASYNIEIYPSIVDFDHSDIYTKLVMNMPTGTVLEINIDDNSWIKTPSVSG